MSLTIDQEIARLISDQSTLADEVVSAELELETIITETAQFQRSGLTFCGDYVKLRGLPLGEMAEWSKVLPC